jgi:cytochrome c oxidase assembly protein subunit 11
VDASRNTADRTLRSDNLRMVGKLTVVAGLMFAFGYAMVPMYKSICEALGINVLSLGDQQIPGAAGKVVRNTQVDFSRKVTIEFDANARGPWSFKPEQHSVQVHPGELTTVYYEFRNDQDRTMTAQAIPSYAPKQATAHFAKVECFCFKEHTLKPGESKRWPVVFTVDSKLPKDVATITLSYTFFEVGGRTPPAPTTSSAGQVPVGAGG